MGRVDLYCIVTCKLKSYVKDFTLRVTMYYLNNIYYINCINRINRLDCETTSANFDHYLFCQVTPKQTKNNEYTNAHRTVKNGRFINYNIFLY